jgi:hypothetical protein
MEASTAGPPDGWLPEPLRRLIGVEAVLAAHFARVYKVGLPGLEAA